MTKNQRIRWDLARVCRLSTDTASTVRDDDLDRIQTLYNLSSAGVGGTRQKGSYYSGADYWN